LTQSSHHLKPKEIYLACQKILTSQQWHLIADNCTGDNSLDNLPAILSANVKKLGLPAYLPDLARLEAAFYKLTQWQVTLPQKIERFSVNPTLLVINLGWKNLISLLPTYQSRESDIHPEPGATIILLWQDLETGTTRVCEAYDEALLVLKLVVEELDLWHAANDGGIPVSALDAAIERTVKKGIILAPPSGIRRNPETFPHGCIFDEKFLIASVFTLQWHITQLCDLHCKHCYDRSNRTMPDFEEAVRILDDFSAFCRSHYVAGQVSFTGGNPLLYPNFRALYREASKRNLGIAILGNPTSRERIKELKTIEEPVFFQVSLEGLEAHNDQIRGAGHFQRTLRFLQILKDLDIFAMVMLTLTKDNMDQVIPLADVLRHRTDLFTFNRLSMVGEGANLGLPTREAYISFLHAYLEAAKDNPIIAFKDSLINIVRYQNKSGLFGGCTGYGCGAAFNFVSLLSDGEVHACRKFPSPIGNIRRQSLDAIYHSATAQRYRKGCQACHDCDIRPVCGGCLAVSYSHGLNIFEEIDPYCFMDQA